MRNKAILLAACLAMLLSLCALSPSAMARPKTIAQYETEIRSHFKQQMWDRGKQVLDEAIKKYPRATQMNELMGEYYLHLKMYDNARFFYIRAIQLFEGNDKARYGLVKVEEATGNLSSAICYVNELLESEPYNRDLWYKKASLYERQGNIEEAERLMRRELTIFPNDTLVRRRYLNRVTTDYEDNLRSHHYAKAAESLRALIAADPANSAHYDELCDLYIKQGNKNAAIAIAEEGMLNLHGDVELAKKKIGILLELHRYDEALTFIRDYERAYGAGISHLRNYVEEEAARSAVQNDPYVMQGRLYERTHSDEALRYLTNTAYVREYNDDALFYIGEGLKKAPKDVRLTYMKYMVYQRMGYHSMALKTLRKAFELAPGNEEVTSELSFHCMHDAANLMNAEQYEEALPLLDFILQHDTTRETVSSAANRKYVCLTSMGRYADALPLLQQYASHWTDDTPATLLRAYTLAHMEQESEALALLHAQQNAFDVSEAYEEIAVPYIKGLLASGATAAAYPWAKQLVEVRPESRPGLAYLMTCCGLLHRQEELEDATRRARQLYPNDVEFKLKEAGMLNAQGRHAAADSLLRPLLDSLPHNPDVIRMNSAIAHLRIQNRVREAKTGAVLADSLHATKGMAPTQQPWRQIIAWADSALRWDSQNKELLHDKGLAYERLHIYDSAALFQKHYVPSAAELADFERHQKEMLYRACQNDAQVFFQRSRLGTSDTLHGLAGITYTRRHGNETFGAAVHYAGREGYREAAHYAEQGGAGVQLSSTWQHTWHRNFVSTLSGGWASRYFPRLHLNVKGERDMGHGWGMDLHAGYRRLADATNAQRPNLWNIGVGGTKDLHPFLLGGMVDVLANHGLYFNASLQARFYPYEGTTTSLQALVAMGTAPEANVLDMALGGSFNRLNTTVGLGGNYLITKNLNVTVMGTWLTYYDQRAQDQATGTPSAIATQYVNLFNLLIQFNLHI